MRRDYAIAFTGPTEGFVRDLIEQFGCVESAEQIALDTNAQVVIVDCDHVGHVLDSEALAQTLARSRTVGLLHMDDCDRTTLAGITGRRFARHIENVFVRKRNGGAANEFTYTIVPALDRPGAVVADVATTVRRLERQVFTADSGGSTVVSPNPPTNGLWIDGDYSKICASRSRLMDNEPFEYDLANMQYYPGYSTVSFNLTVDSYWYYCNGQNGDGNYYLILLATYTNCVPFAHTDVYNIAGPQHADIRPRHQAVRAGDQEPHGASLGGLPTHREAADELEHRHLASMHTTVRWFGPALSGRGGCAVRPARAARAFRHAQTG